MKRLVNLGAAALLGVSGGVIAQTAPTADAPVAAQPAQPKVKVRPKLIAGGDPAYPPEALALGHSGVAVFSVVIAADGSIKESALISSSKSLLLDQASAASLIGARFSPGQDEAGQSMELRVRMPFEFDRWSNGGEGGDLLTYRCADFTLDNTWWTSVHAEADKPRLYDLLLGLRVLSRPKGLQASYMVTEVAAARKDWERAKKACLANPDSRLIDHLEQREVIKQLSAQR